jgi:hypothetical protein
VIPQRLNSYTGEFPKRKNATFRTWRIFEIKNVTDVAEDPAASIASYYRRMHFLSAVL